MTNYFLTVLFTIEALQLIPFCTILAPLVAFSIVFFGGTDTVNRLIE
jgi:hypothetical protein